MSSPPRSSPPLRPIRVAQVVRPAAGGMRSHVHTLVNGFDAAEVACHLFAPAEFALPSPDTPHSPLPIAAKTRPFRDYITIRRLSEMLRGRFDLVHAHGLRGALIGVLAARRAAIPALFTLHNLVPDRRSHLLMLRFIAPMADAVIAVSRAVAASLQSVSRSIHQLVVIPNGIELAPFRQKADVREVRTRFGLPAEAPLIVGLGRLAPEKGFDVLIRAFRKLGNSVPAPTLALAGAGPEEGALKQSASGSPHPIHFLGEIRCVAPLLAAADLVVIPSRTEGQGIVALEAMAAGRPIAASRVGGLIETLDDGKRGLLVPPDDPEALAVAIERLLQDPQERRQLGEAGRRIAEEEFSAERMVQRTTALYHNVLSAKT